MKRPESKIDEKQIQENLKKKVAPHKRLVGGVKFVDEIPKNPVSQLTMSAMLDRLTSPVVGQDSAEDPS